MNAILRLMISVVQLTLCSETETTASGVTGGIPPRVTPKRKHFVGEFTKNSGEMRSDSYAG